MKNNESKPDEPAAKPESEPDKPKGVKVTKGGISKFVDPSQVGTYKANGWK